MLLALAAVTLLAAGCSRSDEGAGGLSLPPTTAMPRPASHGLAVDPYVRVHEEPDPSSPVVVILRQGDIFSVQDDRPTALENRWIKARFQDRTGYALSSQVRLFASRAQALNATVTMDSNQ